jgi:hypothetical protein
MTTCQRPADSETHSFGQHVWAVHPNTAVNVARVETNAKVAGKVQAGGFQVGTACADDARADLEAIARMASEGGPGG